MALSERLFYFQSLSPKGDQMSETMTTKQLAEVAGVNISTIQKIARKLYPEMGGQKGRIFHFNELQAQKILENVGKKNFVERKISDPERKNSVLESRMDRLEAGLERLANIVTLMVNHQIAEKKEQISLPPINYRSELNSMIRVYAVKNEIPFNVAWHRFYNRALYRIRKNFELCASNEGKLPLDWAEENGYIEQLYQLAKEEF